MSRRELYTPPTPPSYSPSWSEWMEEQRENSEPDQFEMQRQWLEDNHHFPTDETYHPPAAPGIAFHVHDVFDSIRDNAYEIMDSLGGPHPDLYIFQIGPKELLTGFYEWCVRILRKHYSSPKLEIEMDKLLKIIQKLELAKQEYLQSENISIIFTAIQFVIRQPDVFQKYYVDLFIEDTFNAYHGKDDTISCPKGIVERIIFAIADACLLYCVTYKKKRKPKKNKTRKTTRSNNTTRGGVSQYKKCDNPLYRKLIRLFKKEVPDINVLTSEWARILDDTEGIANMTAAELKINFIDFMTRKYKSYGLTQQTEKIKERADHFEELLVFEKKAFY